MFNVLMVALAPQALAGPLSHYTGDTCDFSGDWSWTQTNGFDFDVTVTQDANNAITLTGTSTDGLTTCEGSGQAGGRAIRFSYTCETGYFGEANGAYSAVVDLLDDELTGVTWDRFDPWSVAVWTTDHVFTGCPTF